MYLFHKDLQLQRNAIGHVSLCTSTAIFLHPHRSMILLRRVLTRLAKHTLPPPKGCIWSCNVVQLALHRSNSTTTKNNKNY